jgi:ABC-type nitrate/sulfonate/bicarbonate transport system permease component
VLLGIVHLFLPPEQQTGSASAPFFYSLAHDPALVSLQYALAAFGAALAFAVVPAISMLALRFG